MKKYLAFGKYYFKDQISSILDFIGPMVSYIIHIFVLSQLFDSANLAKHCGSFNGYR